MSYLLTEQTIEGVEILYPPTEGLNEVNVTFQKGLYDGTSPLMPIEVLIDIDDFQDNELVTLVNISELSDEQKRLIGK